MSGGSFNYLFAKDAEDIYRCEEELERMSQTLAQLGYAEDAAMETETLLLIIRQVRTRINARLTRLNPVFKAIEWWKSGDSNEDTVKEALTRYRGETL